MRLLFTIGLEFALPSLARIRGALLGLGRGAVAIAACVTAGVALLLGIGGPGAPHGRAALGILLFQDLGLVAFLVGGSGLSSGADEGC